MTPAIFGNNYLGLSNVTTSERTALPTSIFGLMVYDSTADAVYQQLSTGWTTSLNANNPVYTGTLSRGTLTYSPSNSLLQIQSSVNSYNQLIVQNSNAGAVASADIVVNNNISTDTTYYGNLGMNSSAFAGTGSLNLPNAVYLTSTSGDLVIGTTTSNSIRFVINNGATDALTIGTGGAITTGVWQGAIVAPAYGGNGVANTGNMTWGGAVTYSGAYASTFTLTGITTVTFPTSGTLVNTAVATLSSLASIGTITTGVWNGTIITGTYGGTGVNNGAKTFTYFKNISFTAADDTGAYTLPTGTNTLVATTVTALSSLVTIGTITSGGLGTGAVIGGATMTLGSDANYDMYYRNASGVLTRLANGTTGQVITATTGAAPSWASAAASGANTALSNLASVAVNTSLLTGSSGVDLGSATKPYQFLWLGGSATWGNGNYFKFIGTPTSTRNITIPNNSGTLALTGINNIWGSAQSFNGTIYVASQINSFSPNNQYSYRPTNAGADSYPYFFFIDADPKTTGWIGMTPDSQNGFVFSAGNGTNATARVVLKPINLTNTANSESGDLGIYTQTGGAAAALRLTISSTSILSTVPFGLPSYTVGTLPAGTQGMYAYVTDALAPTWGVAPVAGGAIKVPVFYNGSAWVVN